MNYIEFIDKLIEYSLCDSLFKHELNFVIHPLSKSEDIDKIITLYFIYITSGSSAMPLDSKTLKKELFEKLDGSEILLCSQTESSDEIKTIEDDISKLKEEVLSIISNIDLIKECKVLLNETKLFYIDNNFLFTRQYYNSKVGIKESVERLFLEPKKITSSYSMDVKSIWPTAASAQKEIVDKGVTQNLIVTGGPGTGKTTAVFYLLLALLKNNKNYNLYLTAPSGKAASRIKESINGEIDSYTKSHKEDHFFDSEIEILKGVEGNTIHRLLELDLKTNSFKKNESNKFDSNSIFIIDESSMIDVVIFDSLLKAIPSDARVFILGDKYQLPSVECGAVLSDLLSYDKLKDNIVELTESHRFEKGSPIYDLSQKVNNGVTEEHDFKEILEDNPLEIVPWSKGKYPVFYYDSKDDKQMFEKTISSWAENFYNQARKESTDIDFNEETLDSIFSKIDDARVLCAENRGRFGVSTINNIMLKKLYSYSEGDQGFYPGVPLMITENNQALELYNGDTGVVVKFKDSPVLYFLIEKENKKYKDDSKVVEDKILKCSKYMLYPLRMLDLKKIVYAYSITIHKSQGSGYKNIMVILPKKKGHPLLNRQILYTAITRTKGPTYIISDNERMNEAVSNVIKRYTRIFD